MLSWQTMVWVLAILGAGLLGSAIFILARKLFGTRRGAGIAAESVTDDRASLTAAPVLEPAPIPPRAAPAKSVPLPPLPGKYEYDYFISYNKEWDHIAALVAEVLAREGKTVSAWVQRYDSKRGENLVSQVNSAIEKSRHFIALLSEAYITSPWTKDEAQWFIGHRRGSDYYDRKIIVLKCEELGEKEKNVPGYLMNEFYGELFNKPGDDAKKIEIMKTLRGDAARARPALHDQFDTEILDPENFIGRKRELEDMARHFFPDAAGDADKARMAPPPLGQRRVLLHAGPGFGKTSLARKFAHDYKAWFSSASWLPAENPEPLLKKIVGLGSAKSDTTPTVEDARKALQARFEGARAPHLLIFDNVDAATQPIVKQLLACLPPSVRVISTAWFRDTDPGAHCIELQAFDTDEAAALLRHCAESDDVAGSLSLARKLGGHPLALNHAGTLCKISEMPFAEYEERHLKYLKNAPEGNAYAGEYEKHLKRLNAPKTTADAHGAVFATVMLGLEFAGRMKGVEPGDVGRLADFLSYCAADRIPRSLFRQAIPDADRLNAAVRALREVSLLRRDQEFAGVPAASIPPDRTVAMHRLVQRIIRDEADANGRSPAVVGALVPFLHKELHDIDDKSANGDAELRFNKYFPHLLQALPELDAPDFRGEETSNILDDLAKLVVLALTRHYAAQPPDAAEAYPERLPGLLGCFYEVDPLGKPLDLVLDRLRNKEDWRKFRDACLKAQNYVLRFALADALAERLSRDSAVYDLGELNELLNHRELNHFELGGYALKSYYSDPEFDDDDIDSGLLSRLAKHPCYPGRSILGDLLLNLVYQGRPIEKLLPQGGDNSRFWEPVWDFVSYDVNAIRAAGYANRGATPPESEAEDVRAEYIYRLRLEGWQEKLGKLFRNEPIVAGIVTDFFSIGSDTKRLEEAAEPLRALPLTDTLAPLFCLLFGHPLWSVAEWAASVFAARLRDAKNDPEKTRAHIAMIEALFERDLPWRVRYGAMETAFQIRLTEKPHHSTFFKGVRLFYSDPISKIRGLCAENLLSIMLNGSDKQRVAYEFQFRREIRRWLRDEDCWVLEHVHRYFHALHERAQIEKKDARYRPSLSIRRFMTGKRSPLTSGLGEWWTQDRQAFLEGIEKEKKARARPPIAGARAEAASE